MKHVEKIILEFTKSKFKEFDLVIIPKENRSEALIFETTINNEKQELLIKSINLDTEMSIKVPKVEFSKLKENLWLVLVLILENEVRGLYIINSKTVSKPDNYIFIDNETRYETLSNYEIKIFRSAFEELSKYSIENMIKSIK